LAVAILAVCWAGIALADDLAAIAHPEELGFAPDRLKRITSAYQGYIDRGELPGAVMVIARTASSPMPRRSATRTARRRPR